MWFALTVMFYPLVAVVSVVYPGAWTPSRLNWLIAPAVGLACFVVLMVVLPSDFASDKVVRFARPLSAYVAGALVTALITLIPKLAARKS